MAKTATKPAPASNQDTRIAPDPLSAVLPALGALGTIASIAAINWVAQDKSGGRAKPKRRAHVGLRDLESCCLGLRQIFVRFASNPTLFAGRGGAANAPLKFGVHGRRVDSAAARSYQTMMNDIASMMVLASQNSVDVMSAIEDGEIDAPEEVFFGFCDQQERLNNLIAARESVNNAVATGADIADKLLALVRQLKKYRVS